MTKPQLILHIGIAKTGSSYIQSSLALSMNALLAHGILYPPGPRTDRARAGQITSGNLPMRGDWITPIDSAWSDDPTSAVLFSAEGLSRELLAQWAQVKPLLSRWRVKIIAYCRNPVSHVLSSRAQLSKRANKDVSVTDYLQSDPRQIQLVDLLDRLEDIGAEIVLMNYSHHADALLNSFAMALGVDQDVLVAPPVKRVNRGLSTAEQVVQDAFNRHYGPGTSSFVSDVLCNELPNVVPAKPSVSRPDYDRIVDAFAEPTKQLNLRLPKEEQLVFEPFQEFGDPLDPDAPIELSRAQIDVLVRSISRVLNGEQLFRAKDGKPLILPQRHRDAFFKLQDQRRAARAKRR